MAKKCFVINPNERSSFKDLVNILEEELDDEQRLNYIALTNQYYQEKLMLMANGIQTSKEIQRKAIGEITNDCGNITQESDLPAMKGYLRSPSMGTRI